MFNNSLLKKEVNVSFKITTYEHKDWVIKTFNNFYEHIKDSLDELDEVFRFIALAKEEKTFRWMIEIKNVQYLLLVDPGNKIVNFYSKNLFFEKLLIESVTDIDDYIKEIEYTPLSNSPSFVYYNSIINDLPLFNEDKFSELGDKTIKIANELKTETSKYSESIFEKMSNFALDLTAKYSLIRIHVLKFLAILPNLDHDKGPEIKRVFDETLRRLKEDSKVLENEEDNENLALPKYYILLINIVKFICSILPAATLAYFIRKAVSILATRFIAGTNIKDAKSALKGLKKSGRDFTIDQLGELVVSNAEADHYMNKVIELIEGLRTDTPNFNASGVNEEHVSIKVSALSNDFRPYAFDAVYAEVSVRLKKILMKAKECNVFINVDAEHYHFRDIVFDVFEKMLLTDDDIKDFKYTGIVVQAYLKDSIHHLNDVLELAKKRGIRMPIRLVKGAYWDAETVETKAHNLESFQFLNKEETDLNFRQMCYIMLKNHEHLNLAVASHNILDHSFAEALRELYFKDAPVIEHQCLHMTYEALSNGLSQMGYPTRNYIPVGDLLVGMAYLVRRIMENSSQVGILTIMRSHKGEISYNHLFDEVKDKIHEITYVYSNSLYKFEQSFKNIYPSEVYKDEKIENLKGLIEDYKTKELDGVEYDTTEVVNSKIENLKESTDWGKNTSLRLKTLLHLSNELLYRRDYFTALIMKEANKTIEEALADVDEAIDFINFYTKEAVSIKRDANYTPKGIFAVIAPWNFPLAIPVGMSVAALATGNKVIIKPSEKTPLIVKEFYDLAMKCGISGADYQITVGDGEIGKLLTTHEDIDGIVFTGSKAVGVQIYKSFKPRITQKVPTVITEMGGKNAIIVTNNAELDETVSEVMYSCFAHAGQKCSAASRIIVDNKIKDAFLARFIEAAKDVKIGTSLDLSTYINPLIGKDEKELTLKRISDAKEEVKAFGGKILLDRSTESDHESLIGPTIIELPASRSIQKESMAQKEFFAPVIHVIGFDDIEQAVDIFNSTEYALTGGIFSQSTDDYEYLMQYMDAGNLYVNRSNTGARVAIEPFGGFKMSGTGPKAGSKEYLYSFVDFNKVEPHDLLKSFYKYLRVMNFSFLNRQIPGQISFDSRKKEIGRGLFIVDRPLMLRDKIEIVMCILAGNFISIYSTEHNFVQKRDYDFFEKFAFVEVPTLSTFIDSDYSHYDFIVGDDRELNKHAKGFIDTSDHELKKVFNYSDYKDDFYLYLFKYTHAKSFAINIMRHGAAMSLQEDI